MDPALSELAVISVLFNPVRYQTRYKRFAKFRKHMQQAGVDLVIVECIFPHGTDFGLPPQRFEMTVPGHPKHIQVIAPSIMWMKENLVNIAAQRLSPHIKYIAWVDADVEFQRPDWPYLTLKTLRKYPIAQLFRVGYFTGPQGRMDILRKDYSFGYSIRHNKPIDDRYPGWYAHPGYAWAMHRHLFDAIGGLLDFCIVGSGDLHFAYALLGRIDETMPHGMSPDYRQTARVWGDQLAHIAKGGANVGYVNTDLFHRWHGSRESRSYVNRWSILIGYQFSPSYDLTRDNPDDVIGLKKKKNLLGRLFSGSGSRLEDMERAIVDYFISRNEDRRDVFRTGQMFPSRGLRGSSLFSFGSGKRRRPRRSGGSSGHPFLRPGLGSRRANTSAPRRGGEAFFPATGPVSGGFY